MGDLRSVFNFLTPITGHPGKRGGISKGKPQKEGPRGATTGACLLGVIPPTGGTTEPGAHDRALARGGSSGPKSYQRQNGDHRGPWSEKENPGGLEIWERDLTNPGVGGKPNKFVGPRPVGVALFNTWGQSPPWGITSLGEQRKEGDWTTGMRPAPILKKPQTTEALE
ncbi:hypothetical protein GOBAR_AA27186 [Gossypium barbadense]|uniref:Uncharacterized protein n=1 Tax=Gossypium barbadense TaxID=3634 RepID=A0A2P5WR05_GOSBA|nr:hypothetical protein GOBAR_AA27186 [Gossypium barbadense]